MLVSEGTGFVVNPDARELSGAVRTIITDGILRKKMSVAALYASRAYDWDMMVSELTHLYMELI
jgi:glycosyltransferase involved in cell wall biosynthesis